MVYEQDNADHVVHDTAITLKYEYETVRPFMHTDADPNEYYRSWMETNIGQQGLDWDWELQRDNMKNIKVYFAKKEHGTLFELVWT